MVVNPGECIDPERAAAQRAMLDAMDEQRAAGADWDMLADIYPEVDGAAEFKVYDNRASADVEPEQLELAVEPEQTEPTDKPEPEPEPEPAEEQTAPQAPAPAAKRRKLPKARTPHEKAVRDRRDDLKPFPFGSMEE